MSVPKKLYEVIIGPFRCTPIAASEEDALRQSINDGQWHVQNPEAIESLGVPTVINIARRTRFILEDTGE